jgi:catalase
VQTALLAAGANVHLIAPRLGPVNPSSGKPLHATGTLENSPPVLFDGLVLPDGTDGVTALGDHIEVMDFISNQYRHGKTILALGASKALIERSGVSATLASGDADPGMVMKTETKADLAATAFIAALGKHRHPEREASAPSP